MSIAFTDTEFDAPADTVPIFDVDEALPSDTRACKECGDPLPEKTGPGRKPTVCDACKAKKTARPARTPSRGSNQDVTKALATMDTIYQGTVLMARIIRPPLAIKLASQIPAAQELNRTAFEADRKLARRVASMGAPGGMGAFIVAQGLMIAPIVGEVTASRKTRKEMRNVDASQENTPPAESAMNHTPPNFF